MKLLVDSHFFAPNIIVVESISKGKANLLNGRE